MRWKRVIVLVAVPIKCTVHLCQSCFYWNKQNQASHSHSVIYAVRSYKLCIIRINIISWHCFPRPVVCPVVTIYELNWRPSHHIDPNSGSLLDSALFTLTLVLQFFFLHGLFPFCTVKSIHNSILHPSHLLSFLKTSLWSLLSSTSLFPFSSRFSFLQSYFPTSCQIECRVGEIC